MKRRTLQALAIIQMGVVFACVALGSWVWIPAMGGLLLLWLAIETGETE